MHMGSEKIIEMRKEYLLPCLNYFYKDPPQFVKGDMQYLYDEKGKKYLDFFAGVSVMNCGHSNEFILEKIIEQLKQLQHVTNIYLTQPVVELAEKMAHILPGDLSHSFFCNSGSEANEGAMLLARNATNKQNFIALDGSLHGRTYLTMSVTSIPMWRADPFLPNVVSKGIEGSASSFIGDVENYTEESFRNAVIQLEEVLKKDADNIAAFIVEPIQGNAGIITPPDWYFKEISKILKKYDVLMIVDEVQTGFARTGKMFAIEHYGVVPDIITYSKAFGNGIPVAGFSTNKTIAKKFTKPSASTLGGNPVSCAAALAVIEYIEKNDLCKKSEALGMYLFDKLNLLKNKYSKIKSVRGKGLMLGIYIADDENKPLPGYVDKILETLKDNGIILGKNGIARNVLAFQPPLIINEKDIDFLIENLDRAFEKI